MRLVPEQVKAGLLHEELAVRSMALLYFGRSLLDDPTVMPAALAAIERFGLEETFERPWPLAELGQTPATIDWAIGELVRVGVDEHRFGDTLVQLLLKADPRLTSPRRDEILAIDGFFDDEVSQLKLRWEIESWPTERLWQEIKGICDEGKNESDSGGFRYQDAEWMIDAIGRRSDGFPDWGLAVLETRIPDDAWEGNPDTWMQPLLAKLAERLRHEPAALPLIARLYDDAEVLNDAAQAALVRIGTDEVVAQVRAAWDNAPAIFRDNALGVLGWMRSDAGVTALVGLLPRIEDGVSRFIAAMMLAGAFSTEANEAVRDHLLERDGAHNERLLEQLSASCRLLGQEMPELDQWWALVVEQQQSQVLALERQVERLQRQLDRLHDGQPALRLDEDEQLPPAESFVVGPIRVKKVAGRNDPCPCGSGKKYKKCCWGRTEAEAEVGAPQ